MKRWTVFFALFASAVVLGLAFAMRFGFASSLPFVVLAYLFGHHHALIVGRRG